jgi:hypothetical protein
MLVFFALLAVSKIVILAVLASPTIENIALSVIVPIAAILAFWIALRFFLNPFCDLLVIRKIMLRSEPKETSDKKENNVNDTYSKPYPIGGEIDTE